MDDDEILILGISKRLFNFIVLASSVSFFYIFSKIFNTYSKADLLTAYLFDNS